MRDRLKHSDDALMAIGLGQVQELSTGELWVPGSVDGYVIWQVNPTQYNVKRCYRYYYRSKVLYTGTFNESMTWIKKQVIS